jgi:hypothetical protein
VVSPLHKLCGGSYGPDFLNINVEVASLPAESSTNMTAKEKDLPFGAHFGISIGQGLLLVAKRLRLGNIARMYVFISINLSFFCGDVGGGVAEREVFEF